MSKKGDKTKNQNLKLVAFFLITVCFLLLGSLTYRFISLVGKSKFDGQHRFTVYTTSPNSSPQILSFAPDSKTISLVILKGEKEAYAVKRMLHIPIDATITTKEKGENAATSDKPSDKVKAQMQSLILGFGSVSTDLTIIDLIRLWIFSHSIPSHSYGEKVISQSSFDSDLESPPLDGILSSLLSDETITRERVSIQIVNGTGISGLGGELARIINNMGGNVVAVSSLEKVVEQSSIFYYGEKTYTLTKLSKIVLVTPKELKQPGIADIVITIGKKQKIF